MTRFNQRVYEMLGRVLVFSTTYPLCFPKGSQMAQLIEQIETAVGKLSADSISERSGQGAVRISSGDRAQARAALRQQLAAISRTARGLNLGGFWLPREQSDRAQVEFGQLFAKNAEPLQQAFVESHLPPDFIEQLNLAVQKVEKTIKNQTFGKGSRLAAAATLAQTRSEALAALQRLDPMMENLLRDDWPALAVWERARRIERPSKSSSNEETQEPPPVAPATTTAATAAQA